MRQIRLMYSGLLLNNLSTFKRNLDILFFIGLYLRLKMSLLKFQLD